MAQIVYSNHLPYQRYARLQRELQALVDYATGNPNSLAALRTSFAADVALTQAALASPAPEPEPLP